LEGKLEAMSGGNFGLSREFARLECTEVISGRNFGAEMAIIGEAAVSNASPAVTSRGLARAAGRYGAAVKIQAVARGNAVRDAVKDAVSGDGEPGEAVAAGADGAEEVKRRRVRSMVEMWEKPKAGEVTSVPSGHSPSSTPSRTNSRGDAGDPAKTHRDPNDGGSRLNSMHGSLVFSNVNSQDSSAHLGTPVPVSGRGTNTVQGSLVYADLDSQDSSTRIGIPGVLRQAAKGHSDAEDVAVDVDDSTSSKGGSNRSSRRDDAASETSAGKAASKGGVSSEKGTPPQGKVASVVDWIIIG